jgi:RNA recognition motif-containing protein
MGGMGKGGKSHEKNRVFVTKIPQSITKDNLIEYFNQFGALTDCYLPSPNPNSLPPGATSKGANGQPLGPDGRPAPPQLHKGIAFLSFKDPLVGIEILKRQSYEIKPNQYIVVDRADARKDSKGGAGATGSSAAPPMSSAMGSSGGAPMGGPSSGPGSVSDGKSAMEGSGLRGQGEFLRI